MFMLIISIMTLVMGLLLIISPKSGVKKGTEVTEELLKKNRKIGILITVVGVVFGVLWLI